MFCTNCSAPLMKPGETPRSPSSSETVQNPYPFAAPGTVQQNPQQPPQPYPGYRSAYSGSQGYQPYQSSYSNQMPAPQGNASSRAIASMILSIVSIATCGPFLSIPGLILGKMEMNAIRDGQASRAGETFAKIGFYLGIAVTVLSCVLGLIWTAIMIAGAASNSFVD
jgi:hypothetical protein